MKKHKIMHAVFKMKNETTRLKLNDCIQIVEATKRYGKYRATELVHDNMNRKWEDDLGCVQYGTVTLWIHYPREQGGKMHACIGEKKFIAQVIRDILVSKGADEILLDELRQLAYDEGRDDESDSHAED